MTPEEIAAAVAASACFACLSEAQSAALNTYLLAKLAGGSTDPSTLVDEAADFAGLSEQQHDQVQTYLLCQLNNV